jgi:hypothetical protein
MRRPGLPSFLALLLLCLPLLAAAQAVPNLTPQDCVYRQGDDLAWASPTLMTRPGSHTPTGTQIFPTHACGSAAMPTSPRS